MAKLPVKKLNLTECLNITSRMEAVHDTAISGAVMHRYRLDNEAVDNFKLVTINDGNYVVRLEAVSPAAQHFVEEVFQRANLKAALEQAVDVTNMLARDEADAVLAGYDQFAQNGGAHKKFYKHECVPYLIAVAQSAALRRIILDYPLVPAKREKWLEANEKSLNDGFREPMGPRTERLLSQMVHWIYYERHGKKYEGPKPVKSMKSRLDATAKPKAPAPVPKPEVERLPGDNQLATAFKKVKLFSPPEAVTLN